MERLRICDLSFCEDEVFDLSQVQGQKGFVSGFTSGFTSAFSSKPQLGSNIGAGISAGAAAALAGGIAVNGELYLYSSTSASAS
ncbi:hypothetical protein [Nostoc sp. 'Peltigera malacea cyanobiont' DB3992]|uniref:hypothetical protein n=1 Tax=Nostoc sp. 'Peltigera malacea cyanobiont' DB3992 TaxID=1206980 RepID=UPI000C0459C1|nr:hypothetical protein [Nostoc sp. 'Peltigera malacea cyanobiont' DB3992]PHM09143.1 hypothetical protein CK516_16435 [Nostoc sp. 'Peltigera malacea cyanobiont' DB3992]